MAHTEIHVQGMTCQGCVRSVELKLSKVPGVASAHVDLAAAKASVDYDESQTGIDKMIAAVEQIGYHAAPV